LKRLRLDLFASLIAVLRTTAGVAGLAALGFGCGGSDRRLLVVTTTDVSGKTSPCGCHTPKGGLARRATFLDSVRAVRRNVVVLDAGGFFPVLDEERETAVYMLGAMARLGTQAAGVGARELRYGYGFLRENARSAGVPLVCANVTRTDGGQPAFDPWRVVVTPAGTRVGVFGLMAEGADLGPMRDSLRIGSAEAAAREAVAALRAHGASVVVLLSQLGKAIGDSVALHVPGIDLVIAGGGTPVLAEGERVGNAVAVYGGMQGWQVGVADVRLDAGHRLGRITARTVVLGPEVRTETSMAASVKAFEDSLNAHLRLREASFGRGPGPTGVADHYVGMSVCGQCHAREYAQWQTTAHARAWRTLVDQHKESTPECVPCHVTGFQGPGGFRTADDGIRLGNVQCEACHGMGTQHRRWSEDGNTVAKTLCANCHTDITSPTFRVADYWPHIVHNPPPGLRPLPETPAHRLMRHANSASGR